MKTFTVVIETPKGSTLKYDYEEKLHGYCLSKIMPTGMIFRMILALFQIRRVATVTRWMWL